MKIFKQARVKTEKIIRRKSPQRLVSSTKRVKFLKFATFSFLLLAILYLIKGWLVVAMVGWHPITRFAFIKELEKRNGKKVLEELVLKNLILQEASRKKINVDSKDVDEELQKIRENLNAQGITLEGVLAEQGLRIEDLKETIKMQKLIEGIVKDKINISDEEMRTFFEENKSSFPKEAKFEDYKDDITKRLFQEKLYSEYQKLIEDLKTKTNVVYFASL